MASANDMFQKVGRATATTLSAPGYTTGDSSVNIGSTTNWPTDTGVTFAIDVVDAAGERIAGTYNVFRGRVAGASQVDQVVYEGGDAHRSYPSGATTRVYILVSSYRDNRMVDGLMISHNQDGTIKGPSVVTALTGQTLPADTVTTPAITDASVTPAKWTNPYSFKAIVTTTYNTTPTAMTKLVFNAKSYDYNTNFSTATSAYTAPVAGVYRFNANFQTGGSATGRMFLTFYKNGTEIQRGPDGSFTAFSTSIAGDFLLAATDTMTVYYYVADTIPVKATLESVSFSGSLVHKV
jgi:hypothetical protein